MEGTVQYTPHPWSCFAGGSSRLRAQPCGQAYGEACAHDWAALHRVASPHPPPPPPPSPFHPPDNPPGLAVHTLSTLPPAAALPSSLAFAPPQTLLHFPWGNRLEFSDHWGLFVSRSLHTLLRPCVICVLSCLVWPHRAGVSSVRVYHILVYYFPSRTWSCTYGLLALLQAVCVPGPCQACFSSPLNTHQLCAYLIAVIISAPPLEPSASCNFQGIGHSWLLKLLVSSLHSSRYHGHSCGLFQ